MANSKLLIINDVTGYGRVSTFAMLPILSSFGVHAYILPTALVSNTMDYGSAEILDTTSFMKNTIKKWDDFGFKFSYISTGLINSAEQMDLICNLIERQDNPFVIVDPIMADDGILYPDMYYGAVECYRKLASRASLLIPNITEATMLINKYIGRTTFTDSEYEEIVYSLSSFGPKQIVITGCKTFDDKHFNLVYDSLTDSIEKLNFEKIESVFIGTGDVFSAFLEGELLCGTDLKNAVLKSSDFVRKVISKNIDNPDHYDLIIESSLDEIIKR